MKTQTINNELYLGLDPGTTTSQIAVLKNTGIVKVLPNMDGELVTPSIVSVADKKPIVGKMAKQDKFLNPEPPTHGFSGRECRR